MYMSRYSTASSIIPAGVSSKVRIGSHTNVPVTVKTAASTSTDIVDVQTAVFRRPNCFSPNNCETMTLMPMPAPSANAINSMVTGYDAPTGRQRVLADELPGHHAVGDVVQLLKRHAQQHGQSEQRYYPQRLSFCQIFVHGHYYRSTERKSQPLRGSNVNFFVKTFRQSVSAAAYATLHRTT